MKIEQYLEEAAKNPYFYWWLAGAAIVFIIVSCSIIHMLEQRRDRKRIKATLASEPLNIISIGARMGAASMPHDHIKSILDKLIAAGEAAEENGKYRLP